MLINNKSFLILTLLLFTGGCITAQTKVYFIPTLHGLHKINPNYNYDSLINTVADLQPDIIAVEIRAIDLHLDSVDLRRNYPYEMWMMKYWFPNKKLMAFDWLGDEINGKPIPDNYWTEISVIKKYEKALHADTTYNNKKSECAPFINERLELLKALSLKELLNSKNEELTNQYYQCLSEKLSGSIHKRIIDFYDKRNNKILENIKKIARKNKGKTIVILTGDDHYNALKTKLIHLAVFSNSR